MKPTKMRNKQIYRASLKTVSKQIGSTLSKDLRQKYGRRTIRVIKGDSVKVMRGEYKGVDGKVSKVLTEKGSVAIEGIKKEKSKGDKFDIYIHASNVMITGLNSDDHWRKSKLEHKEPKKTPKEIKKPKEDQVEVEGEPTTKTKMEQKEIVIPDEKITTKPTPEKPTKEPKDGKPEKQNNEEKNADASKPPKTAKKSTKTKSTPKKKGDED